MAATSSLVDSLRKDFPHVRFLSSDDYYWSAHDGTVHYGDLGLPHSDSLLLHETAHSLLQHANYDRDITLIKMEREAWEYARNTLAPRYRITIDEGMAEDMIDTYRDWLHARSTCPHCKMTGLQTTGSTYRCLGCDRAWRVNEARRCGLKRTSL